MRSALTPAARTPSRGRRGGAPRSRAVALLGVHTAAGTALMRRLDEDERVSRLRPRRSVRAGGAAAEGRLLGDRPHGDARRRHARRAARARAGRRRSCTRRFTTRRSATSRRRTSSRCSARARCCGRSPTTRATRHGGERRRPRVDARLRRAPRQPAISRARRRRSAAATIRSSPTRSPSRCEVARFRARTGIPAAMLRASWTLGDAQAARRSPARAADRARRARPGSAGAAAAHRRLVDAVLLAAHGLHDGAFNVAGGGVLPLSTIVKLAGAAAGAGAGGERRGSRSRRSGCSALGVVPGAHVALSPRHVRRRHRARDRGARLPPALLDARRDRASRRAFAGASRSTRRDRRAPSVDVAGCVPSRRAAKFRLSLSASRGIVPQIRSPPSEGRYVSCSNPDEPVCERSNGRAAAS